ncbi:T9SS type A sorting domain-containing protein [Crocinitomix catalasitica]|nr:T9SS type A sorting domain-containing protein [Crocinitomix catalasitica]
MKKFYLTGLILISLTCATAQTTLTLDQNNASAKISDNGVFFNDPASSGPGYEIPKGDGNHTSYAMALWLTALDGSSALHAACNRFESAVDMFPGPIADDYTSTYYTDNFGSAIWKVSKAQIDFHKANYTSSGYIPIDEIANWPGNGNTAEGVADQLAPYIDINDDFVYDPLSGDYPYIQGDEAVYVILNDAADVHFNTGGTPLEAEIHLMFFQFITSDDVNNTTFMNATVYNRSSNDYTEFRLGVYLDFDIGFFNDDFVGCDSTKNLIYGYNSLDFDPGGSGQPGYGANTPAFGVMYLNQNIRSAMYYNNSGAANGDPAVPSDYVGYMNSTWKNGQPLYYGGNGFDTGTTTEVDFMFTGNPNTGVGWSEVAEGHISGDRRMVMCRQPSNLDAGTTACVDVVFIYSRNGTTAYGNAEDLSNVADAIQNFYDNNVQACTNIFTGIKEDIEASTISIYPNPTNGNINIEAEGTFALRVLSLDGQLVANLGEFSNFINADLDLENGIYLLEISCESGRSIHKVQFLR